jgi:hypothetical protein
MYDFTNEEAATAGSQSHDYLPPGDWRVKITAAEVYQPKSGGDDLILVTFALPAEDLAHSPLRVYFAVKAPETRGKIAREQFASLLDATGTPRKFRDLAQLVGKKAVAHARVRISEQNPAWSRCEPRAYSACPAGTQDRPMDDPRFATFLAHRAEAAAARASGPSAPRAAAPSPFAAPAQSDADDDIPF